MDEVLKRRIVGAVVLLVAALLLSALLPEPQRGSATDDDARALTYEFHGPAREAARRPTPSPVSPEPPADVASATSESGSAQPAVEPAPSAAARQVPPPVRKEPSGTYFVQIATFRERGNAVAAIALMKRHGHSGAVRTLQRSRGPLYQVRLGPYGSAAEARAAQVEAEAQGFGGSKLIGPERG